MSLASTTHSPCRLKRNSIALSASSSMHRTGNRNWELLAVWVCVVLCFAALAFAGYVIWAKCASPSPFY